MRLTSPPRSPSCSFPSPSLRSRTYSTHISSPLPAGCYPTQRQRACSARRCTSSYATRSAPPPCPYSPFPAAQRRSDLQRSDACGGSRSGGPSRRLRRESRRDTRRWRCIATCSSPRATRASSWRLRWPRRRGLCRQRGHRMVAGAKIARVRRGPRTNVCGRA